MVDITRRTQHIVATAGDRIDILYFITKILNSSPVLGAAIFVHLAQKYEQKFILVFSKKARHSTCKILKTVVYFKSGEKW